MRWLVAHRVVLWAGRRVARAGGRPTSGSWQSGRRGRRPRGARAASAEPATRGLAASRSLQRIWNTIAAGWSSGDQERDAGETSRSTTSTWSTWAIGGPRWHQATTSATVPAGPSSSTCTRPSARFRTHPPSLASFARLAHEARNPTPWTLPDTSTCLRTWCSPRWFGPAGSPLGAGAGAWLSGPPPTDRRGADPGRPWKPARRVLQVDPRYG